MLNGIHEVLPAQMQTRSCSLAWPTTTSMYGTQGCTVSSNSIKQTHQPCIMQM